jgi:outer membrane protein insertion porin family
MSGRLTAAILFVFLLGFPARAVCQSVQPATSTDSLVTVAGNRHADAALIRSYFHAGADGTLDAAALDTALKSLYGTGLFQDVKISPDGGRVLVSVVENPAIEKMAFEGNKKIKDDDLKKAVQSKPGGPLSRALVRDDVAHIVELYRQHGYFDARVEPKTIAAKKDRVNLVFEIKEGDKLAVRQIQFTGNSAYVSNKLKGVIRTGETNFFSFLLDNDIYDADRIEADLDLIRRFYRAHGYADVRVRSVVSYQADKMGVVVTYAIEEGQQYRLGRVDIASSLKSVDAAGLRSYLRTQAGEVYDADAVDKAAEDIAIGLAKSGEPFATVLARNERLPERHLINIVYAIEAGKHIYVERIDIHGNTKTRDDVIRREFDVVEGDAYNRALIDRAERRLKQLGYFDTVKIASQPGSAPDRVVVDVMVEEQKTGDFTISGGYSTADGVLATVSVGDTNFWGPATS